MLIKDIISSIEYQKTNQPLVLNITNSVVENFNANLLLAVGASPLMCHAKEEIKELVTLADSLVINIGTLNSTQTDLMLKAVTIAKELNKPCVVDPVGAGASRYRTETVKKVLQQGHNIILKGNASEILALVDDTMSTHGVDSRHESMAAIHAAKVLLSDYALAAVIITGKTDYVIDKDQASQHDNGIKLLQSVTGTGCGLAAVLGAFVSQEKCLSAIRACISYYTIASELAYEKARLPGSFSLAFLDMLYTLSPKEVMKRLNVSYV